MSHGQEDPLSFSRSDGNFPVSPAKQALPSDWGPTRWARVRDKRGSRCLATGGLHGPAPGPGRWVPRETRANQEATVCVHRSAPPSQAPGLPLCCGRCLAGPRSQSSSPQRPRVASSAGQQRSKWGSSGQRPLGLGDPSPPLPPRGPGGSTRQLLVPPRPEVCGAEPARPLPRFPARGGGSGDTVLSVFLPQLLGLRRAASFFRQSAAQPVRLPLTCQEEEKEDHRIPSTSCPFAEQTPGGGGRSILASESPPPRGSVPPDRSGERRGGEGGYPPGRHRRSEASGSPPPRLPPGGHCPTLGAKCPLGCRLGSDLARLKSRSLRVGLRWVAGGLTSALGPSRGRVCGRSDNPHTATQDRACTGPPQPPPPRSQGAGAFVFPKKPAFKCLTPCIFPKFGPSIPVGPSVLGDTVPVPSPLPLPQPCDPAETRARALLGARGCSCHPHPLTLPGPPRACFTDFQLWGKHGRRAWGQLGSVAPCLLQVGGRGQGAGQTSQSRLQKGDCLVCLRVCPRGRVRVPPPCARHPRVRESGQSTRLSAHTEAGPLGGGARVQPVRRLASPPSSEPARGERSPSVPRSVARDAALDGAWPGPELGAGAERRGAR